MAHVSLADVAGERLHVRLEFRAQHQLVLAQRSSTGNIVSRHPDPKEPNQREDDNQDGRNSRKTVDDAPEPR